MTLFNFRLERGTSIIDQVMFTAIRAIVRGEYQPGELFPSVRAIASSLKIHPNTAHKVIQRLIEDQWLEARAGIGTIVAPRTRMRGDDARRLLRGDLDRLIVRGHSHDLTVTDVIDELRKRWRDFAQVREDLENDRSN